MPPVQPELSPEQRTARAREIYETGAEAYALKEYVEAARAFRLAYAYAPQVHALAFNIAHALEQLEHCCLARWYFERYVELDPEGAGRADVDERLQRLQCEPCGDR